MCFLNMDNSHIALPYLIHINTPDKPQIINSLATDIAAANLWLSEVMDPKTEISLRLVTST